MMSAKMATLGVVKIRVFKNKGNDVTISVYVVPPKTLSRESIYIVDVVMWPKFGFSNVSMKEVIITSNL